MKCKCRICGKDIDVKQEIVNKVMNENDLVEEKLMFGCEDCCRSLQEHGKLTITKQ